jgi:hypothetical protein
MTRNNRIALMLAAVMVAIGSGIVMGTGGGDRASRTSASGSPGPGANTPAERQPKPVATIHLVGGRPIGGVQTLQTPSGKPALFAVTSEIPAQIQLRGYNILRSIPANGRVTFSFRAITQGVFDLESRTTNRVIGRLKVLP